MTRFYYDTEFLEDGVTIDLISIGIVREDGETYYAVNDDADWQRIRKDEWLMANVFPHLPFSGDWKPKAQIRDEVLAFLTSTPLGWVTAGGNLPSVELWAWYSAYDHVALAQLFGKMIDLPSPPLPMFTNDLRSLCDWTGIRLLPKQEAGQHDALADAQWVKLAHEHVMRLQ